MSPSSHVCRLFGMSAGKDPAKAKFWLLDASQAPSSPPRA
jgi:hypothetical protein